MCSLRFHAACAILLLSAFLLSETAPAAAQQLDSFVVIRRIDAAVANRVENVLDFTDTQHYAVYRGKDQTHPAAEMTVRETYRKGEGKNYVILSESGSSLVLRFGLHPLLENEKKINEPGNVASSWFTSANYAMTLQPGGIRRINGRDCYALAIAPRQKAPNMVDGTLWVDARDGSIVQVEGIASRSPSPFAGTTHMTRQYTKIDGFPMAVHARAESSSPLIGRTVVVIEYSGYRLHLHAGQ